MESRANRSLKSSGERVRECDTIVWRFGLAVVSGRVFAQGRQGHFAGPEKIICVSLFIAVYACPFVGCRYYSSGQSVYRIRGSMLRYRDEQRRKQTPHVSTSFATEIRTVTYPRIH